MGNRFTKENYTSICEALELSIPMIDSWFNTVKDLEPKTETERFLQIKTLRNLQFAKNVLVWDRLPEHLKYIDLEKHMYDEED